MMPPDSPEPGPYRADRTPYMIPPTDAAVSFAYLGICIVCGTQQGKTAALFNICFEALDNAGVPCLWVGPTKTNVTTVIEPQFEAGVSHSDSLREKRSGRQSRTLKRIAGTTMRFAWSGSATEIASQPAFLVVVDEVDKCENIPGHGNVLVQAEARISNYRHIGGILVATSSPTEGSVDTYVDERTGLEFWSVAKPDDLISQIWVTFQSGTRHEFMVPCPHCGEFFSPRLKYLQGWAEGDTPAQAKRKAKLLHWKCGSLIDEKHKAWMTANGRAVAPGQRVVAGEVVGEAPDSEWYSIWVSGLLSPWVSWGDSAYQWISAVRSHDQETIRATINLRFGELFRVAGEAPPWEEVQLISTDSIYDLRVIPNGVRKIFLTVDVQKDHLVFTVRGWGVELESWLLERGELWGKTDEPEVWTRLDEMIDKGFEGQSFDAVAIDSGFRTEQVYTFCEKRLSLCYATKGKDKPSKLYNAADVEVLKSGKKVKRGLKVWSFDHGFFKGWTHDRIRWPQDQPGAWHLPRAVGENYCRQIVAEQRMRLPSGKVHWVKAGVNDFLDCEALQVLCAHIEGVRYLKPETQQAPPAPKRGVRGAGVQI